MKINLSSSNLQQPFEWVAYEFNVERKWNDFPQQKKTQSEDSTDFPEKTNKQTNCPYSRPTSIQTKHFALRC